MNENLKVKLVAMTQPLNQSMNAEDFIVYCARVSNPSNQENFATGDRLLMYCVNNAHWSIFEMVNLVFEVEAPRDITRQIIRHSCKPQEFSGRYANPVEDLGFMFREARYQDPNNRQKSIEGVSDSIQQEWEYRQKTNWLHAKDQYDWALKNGLAKECARVVLPEGNIMSRMYVNNFLRNWIHYCEVRMDETAQKEHRIIAQKIWEILLEQFEFLKEYDKLRK